MTQEMSRSIQDAKEKALYAMKELQNIPFQELSSSKEGMTLIGCCYSKCREWDKAIEAKRKELVSPLQDQIKEINCQAKKVTSILEDIEQKCNKSANEYADNVKDAVCLFDEGEEVIKVSEDCDAILCKKTNLSIEIEDVELIDREYLILDEKKVMQMIKAGIRNIPGIRIKEKESFSWRKR